MYKTTEEKFAQVLEGFDSVRKIFKELNLSAWDVEQLRSNYQSIFDRFCPFKVGDRVRLVRDWIPPVDKAHGWSHCAHYLVRSNPATVRSRDYRNGKFVFNIMFDRETWIDYRGEEREVSSRHAFSFTEDWLLNASEVEMLDKSKENSDGHERDH